MNAPKSNNQFVPKQALAPTPQLYDELVGNTMEVLAKESLAQIPSLPVGSVVHDNGCGTGAGSAAVAEQISGSKVQVSIKATDINEKALEILKELIRKNSLPVEALKMDSEKLTFEDGTFTHVIGNALLFVLPNDGIDAVKEMYRTLKPGGTLIVNSWHYTPNVEPLQIAAKATRPPGTPLPRQGMQKWSSPEFLQDVLEKGGFARDNIKMTKANVYCTTPELSHFATMSWSFIGGTSEVGWLKSDEETWDQAIEIVKDELRKTEGYEGLDGGRAKLKFVANIGIATK
jgi:ubiquinone/menaquinone biosynthesis C-methylase UbiE